MKLTRKGLRGSFLSKNVYFFELRILDHELLNFLLNLTEFSIQLKKKEYLLVANESNYHIYFYLSKRLNYFIASYYKYLVINTIENHKK